MLTAILILVVIIIGIFVIRQAIKPSKRNPNTSGYGKSLKAPENVFELIFPRLEDDKTEDDE